MAEERKGRCEADNLGAQCVLDAGHKGLHKPADRREGEQAAPGLRELAGKLAEEISLTGDPEWASYATEMIVNCFEPTYSRLDALVAAIERTNLPDLDEGIRAALAALRAATPERTPQYEVTAQHMESMEEIAKLANFLSEYLPHEISRSENAVDIAIRLMRQRVAPVRNEQKH